MTTRRSLFASLAAFLAAALVRPVRGLARTRRPTDVLRPAYWGYIHWDGVTAKARVWRPDGSVLEPLPVEFVEKELIMLRFKPWKYGTPVPDPGFAWGGGAGCGKGTGQLAAAILLDHTGDKELTSLEARWFTDVLDDLGTLRWHLSVEWLDQWLADQDRLRKAGRLRCRGDGRHGFPLDPSHTLQRPDPRSETLLEGVDLPKRPQAAPLSARAAISKARRFR